jgi:hypothetical protein
VFEDVVDVLLDLVVSLVSESCCSHPLRRPINFHTAISSQLLFDASGVVLSASSTSLFLLSKTKKLPTRITKNQSTFWILMSSASLGIGTSFCLAKLTARRRMMDQSRISRGFAKLMSAFKLASILLCLATTCA